MSRSPFLTIWTSPRATVRKIVAENPSFHVTLLACLAGVGEALDRASTRDAGDKMPIIAIIGIACVLGPLAGLVSLWISSHLLCWAGRRMGGTGTPEHLKTAVAWAAVPAVLTLPLWIPELLLFGSDMFTSETPRLDSKPLLWIFFLVFAAVEVVLSIWSFVLLCHTVAEVQGFRSAWRGFGNVLLAGAVIIVSLFLVIFALLLLTKG